jgi:hypothetical protein
MFLKYVGRKPLPRTLSMPWLVGGPITFTPEFSGVAEVNDQDGARLIAQNPGMLMAVQAMPEPVGTESHPADQTVPCPKIEGGGMTWIGNCAACLGSEGCPTFAEHEAEALRVAIAALGGKPHHNAGIPKLRECLAEAMKAKG